MKDISHKTASATLGVIKPGKPYINRDDVEIMVREKKRFYHKFIDDKTQSNFQIYKNANLDAKKAVTVTRAIHYDKLDTRNGERNLYRLAKNRNERTQDVKHFCCVTGKNGTLVNNRRISTGEFAHFHSFK